MRLSEVISRIDRIIPPKLAEDYDNVGLQVGDEKANVKRALIALDAVCGLAVRAKKMRCELVITHHPLIFSPLAKISSSDFTGRIVTEFLKKDIALFSAHTNFDSVGWGVSHALGTKLGLAQMEPLREAQRPGVRNRLFSKIVVFVPEDDLRKVQRAMFDAGGGVIGAYHMCSWRTPGMGSFRPLAGAHPSIGKRGKYEEVSEYRVEVVAAKSKVPEVVGAMRKAHSYEEPAYDIYPLEEEDAGSGAGVIATLRKRVTLKKMAQMVKRRLGSEMVIVTGRTEKVIRRVAAAGGSGRSLIEAAFARSADVLVTGEVSYHDRLKCAGMGLSLIEAGHFETENPALVVLRKRLQEEIPEVVFVLDKSSKNISRFV